MWQICSVWCKEVPFQHCNPIRSVVLGLWHFQFCKFPLFTAINVSGYCQAIIIYYSSDLRLQAKPTWWNLHLQDPTFWLCYGNTSYFVRWTSTYSMFSAAGNMRCKQTFNHLWARVAVQSTHGNTFCPRHASPHTNTGKPEMQAHTHIHENKRCKHTR